MLIGVVVTPKELCLSSVLESHPMKRKSRDLRTFRKGDNLQGFVYYLITTSPHLVPLLI
jgi:hypothetical protein